MWLCLSCVYLPFTPASNKSAVVVYQLQLFYFIKTNTFLMSSGYSRIMYMIGLDPNVRLFGLVLYWPTTMSTLAELLYFWSCVHSLSFMYPYIGLSVYNALICLLCGQAYLCHCFVKALKCVLNFFQSYSSIEGYCNTFWSPGLTQGITGLN